MKTKINVLKSLNNMSVTFVKGYTHVKLITYLTIYVTIVFILLLKIIYFNLFLKKCKL